MPRTVGVIGPSPMDTDWGLRLRLQLPSYPRGGMGATILSGAAALASVRDPAGAFPAVSRLRGPGQRLALGEPLEKDVPVRRGGRGLGDDIGPSSGNILQR